MKGTIIKTTGGLLLNMAHIAIINVVDYGDKGGWIIEATTSNHIHLEVSAHDSEAEARAQLDRFHKLLAGYCDYMVVEMPVQ